MSGALLSSLLWTLHRLAYVVVNAQGVKGIGSQREQCEKFQTRISGLSVSGS